jgi:hypothetical protein
MFLIQNGGNKMIETILLASFVGNMPWFVWAAFLFIPIMVVLGDRKLWEYEVKFPQTTGVGRGEVEFEAYKKKGTTLEAKFQIDPDSANKDIEICLNDKHVYTIPAQENTGGRVYINKKIQLDKPEEGDQVIIRIRHEEVLSGPLIRD